VRPVGRRSFQGRPVIPGAVTGPAAVSRGGFNTYASFFASIHEPSAHAVCADSGNADLFGVDLAGTVLCVPTSTGSTSGGAVWQRLSRLGNAPRAVLFARSIDSLAAGGLVVAAVWSDGAIVVVDRLGDDFLDYARLGDEITVDPGGRVVVASRVREDEGLTGTAEGTENSGSTDDCPESPNNFRTNF
jgi:predicted aconitase with swiveling domain